MTSTTDKPAVWLAVGLSASLLLGGCARGTTPGEGIATPEAPTASGTGALIGGTGAAGVSGSISTAGLASLPADTLVLRVAMTGMLAPGATIGQLPRLSVYADGRVITEGPTMAIYPGPALPNLQQAVLSRQQVSDLMRGVVAAGVDGERTDWGQPRVADAGATKVTVRLRQSYLSAEVYALGQDASTSGSRGDDDGLTPQQRQQRQALQRALLAVDSAAAATTGYQADRGAVIATPALDQPGDDTAGMVTRTAWPGPVLASGATAGLPEGWHCLTLDAAQWSAVRPSLADSNQLTRWQSQGREWHVVVRPLLPDEQGCADLG